MRSALALPTPPTPCMSGSEFYRLSTEFYKANPLPSARKRRGMNEFAFCLIEGRAGFSTFVFGNKNAKAFASLVGFQGRNMGKYRLY